uniref:Uncharacterized protein n=1 Tax=Cacopsylla melanoneura TaxID=428564 RepID=A0A8D8XYU5_9HEMI
MCVYSMHRSRFGLPGTFFRLVLGPAVLKLRPLEKSKIQRKVGTPPEWMGVCVYSMYRSRFGLIWAPSPTFWASAVPEMWGWVWWGANLMLGWHPTRTDGCVCIFYV